MSTFWIIVCVAVVALFVLRILLRPSSFYSGTRSRSSRSGSGWFDSLGDIDLGVDD